MLENANNLAEQINNYFNCNVELLLIIKSLIDFDCDIEGVIGIDSQLVEALKSTHVQDIACLKNADSRLPLFQLACSPSDLTKAIASMTKNKPKAGSIDHIFASEVK
ncbi:hypothetical protein I6E85_11280 [Pseudoalteromonas sp. NZS71]|uniref:hypothetical protein n=1 Tax=unclassified Pseudoalteromonas TaxID=194690 RepID=UPI000406300E|nr:MULTISPECIES: hypothetical protein [unclassified Pseudoalteromonas]MBH0061738.1 hypothetical protein [Pseudoalteromonas sp. NZS71]|tara:strand:- start:8343 stop:8663 length:321 start_codon:yes stop_codon:yes gene_type:complete